MRTGLPLKGGKLILMVHNNTATAATGCGGDGGYQRVLRERLELTLTTTRIIIIMTGLSLRRGFIQRINNKPMRPPTVHTKQYKFNSSPGMMIMLSHELLGRHIIPPSLSSSFDRKAIFSLTKTTVDNGEDEYECGGELLAPLFLLVDSGGAHV